MMHHPNIHHQQMSGHPPQHMGGHQGMPGHHQLPPHQMHRENRHVTLTRLPLGPSGAGGALGAHGQALGGMGAMGVHHPPAQRPPHPIRAMPHHPQAQHLNPMKQLRRPYGVGGGYGVGGAGGALPPPYAPPPPPLRAPTQPAVHHAPHNVVSTQPTTKTTPTATPTTASESGATDTSNTVASGANTTPAVAGAGGEATVNANTDGEDAATGEGEAARPAAANQANSKEKTPMCLVNELARYNKIKHQYRLTSETGPAHKKVFTVTLRLSDSEEYTAEGSSIKRAQHAAATAALAATSYPPPPQRMLPAHSAAQPHHRHSGAVMPTVELNALAMKLCQPAVYTSIPPATRLIRPRTPYRAHALLAAFPTPALVYRVRVSVGGRAWMGEGATPQAARHDAAARALHDLRPPPEQREPAPPSPADAADTSEQSADLLNSEVKSPVSLVHELALKRNLTVQFSVKSERGPPHMRVFVTACTVGDMETEGEGNGKKVSKRRAAERMLDEMRRRWPPALLRTRPPGDKRRHQPTKKKPRNLIKESGTAAASAACGADNPISRLAVARHAVRARSPQYRVLEERGAARRREFVVQCDAPPHSATGLGPNKKTAKRRAAHNVLMAIEMGAQASNTTGTTSKSNKCNVDSNNKSTNNAESKRKEGDVPSTNNGGGANSDVRQPVPGVLLMDFHQRTGQPNQPNGNTGVSESSATGGTGGSSPGAKDQLMYLSQLIGFSVQFSDFPKRNHGEYLSLVSLSTEPPIMCHGGGPSTAHSHEQCSRAALRSLTMMGLDIGSTTGISSVGGASHKPAAGPKPAALSTTLAE